MYIYDELRGRTLSSGKTFLYATTWPHPSVNHVLFRALTLSCYSEH